LQGIIAGFLLLISFVSAQIEFEPCDPISPERCMLPFPNDFWTVEDSSTATGKRLRIQEATFPVDKNGVPIDPTEWNQLDGFSPTPAIMSFFADVSLANVPPHKDISLSLLDNCPTVILDTLTLQRVPHWAEVDETTPNTSERAFMMWPAYRLVGGRRYIVAIRNLLSTTTGLPIPTSPAFLELLNNSTTSPVYQYRQKHFNEDIFPLLEEAGIPRGNLQLAWDFTVGSTSSITGRLLYMRDDGLSRLPLNGSPNYHILEIQDNVNEYVYRSIKGDMEVPYYTNHPGPGSHLVLDQEGNPVFQGYANCTFLVHIPTSLVANQTSGRVMQYGHGLFGSQNEINNEYLEEIGNVYGYVTVATNWWGMDEFDEPEVTQMFATNITNCGIIPDRSQQGMLNFMILTRLMTGAFASDPNVIFNGVSVIDPTKVSYYGNSQGGIYGCTFMSVSQDIPTGVLGVPGGPYALMLARSVDFDPYFYLIKARYPNPIDRINIINVVQLLWDRSDPSGYMSFVVSNTLENTPPKKIAIQYALGDAQVTWLAALEMGRSMGAYIFPYNVQEDGEIYFGLPEADQPVTTATVQGFSYGAPPVPQTNIPPEAEYDTHGCPRKDQRAIDQMVTLFEDGVIKDYCDGPCLTPTDPPIESSKCNQSNAKVIQIMWDRVRSILKEN